MASGSKIERSSHGRSPPPLFGAEKDDTPHDRQAGDRRPNRMGCARRDYLWLVVLIEHTKEVKLEELKSKDHQSVLQSLLEI